MTVDDSTQKSYSPAEAMKLPQLVLTSRQFFDLELILNGGFTPLKGFLNEVDYIRVVKEMRLADGTLWPMPIVLDVSADVPYVVGNQITLIDIYNNPIAVMTIESRYTPNKSEEVLQVYGTEDQTHFGVRSILSDTKPVYLGGTVSAVALPQYQDFVEHRHRPEELKKMFKEKGWNKIIAFQTRNPMHRAHFEIVDRSAREHDAHILVHPVVGMTKEGDIDYVTRVRSYQKLIDARLKDRALLSLLPLAMRMAGPREALWHALIRKNYGATHFIVGRDHAGPGKDARGVPFYGPYDAQNLVKQFEKEIGITVVPMREMAYVQELDSYLPEDEVKPEHTVMSVSGTEFRKKLFAGEKIPEWFSFPEVIEELERLVSAEKRKGIVIFFTGLSGSGKSTIARSLQAIINEKWARPVTMLDGDVVRKHLSKGLGFSREDRDTNIERIGFVASEVARHGGIAICAAIAPFAEARLKNRQLIGNVGHYVEVFVDTPIEECEARDVKGLYAKARRGELTGFTGVNDPYEVPENPEFVFDTTTQDARASALEVFHYIESLGIL
jgi:sulfate adenylyltransferase